VTSSLPPTRRTICAAGQNRYRKKGVEDIEVTVGDLSGAPCLGPDES